MKSSRMVLAVLTLAALIGGCATTPKGPSPEEEVAKALADYHAVMEAGDVEKILGTFSDDFEGPQGSDKSTLPDYFQGLIDQGAYDDMEFDLAECEIVVDGDTATVGPVNYDGPGGVQSWEYTMTKEGDGVWRILVSEQL